MDELLKELALNTDNQIKCPFQYTENNQFRDCLFRQCMAYRTNGQVFWCARLEQRLCDEKFLHSVEII